MASEDTQSAPIFQVLSGQTVRGTGDAKQQQRFLNEVQYVDYFARRIGECIGMQTLELGVVEDADTQTAFFYASANGGEGSVVNGFITSARKPLTKLVESLRGEHQS